MIRRKNLLPKPVHLTFSDEAEGDAYVARLEQLLDHGVVPAELSLVEFARQILGVSGVGEDRSVAIQ